ncbi:MAG: DNA (cytosine-5-)-methyltransferase [Gammaproteobacteria bacterium]|nr:MAG: DNA (cytosine-5-)-methyltransferase [Gammaproteobacteria bacterium]
MKNNRLHGLKGCFQFADLFAGVGGTRLGFEAANGQCVFTSEYDRHCQLTYRENFAERNPSEHRINSDLRDITNAGDSAIADLIPDHDVLVAGFPCQPFSVAGVSKKRSLGRPDGFACEAQGTLFFDVAQVLRVKRPVAFLLENVKNLASHDGGRTMRVILDTLVKELGYSVYPNIVDARYFVPQHRERVFLVGFREEVGFDWNSVNIPRDKQTRLADILHPENGTEEPEKDYTIGRKARVNQKYVLSDKLWSYLQAYAEKHQARGNGFGFGLFGPDDIARTLSARYYKDGSEILIRRGKSGRARPRRLTPRECARLMGFPNDFRIPVSDTQAYKQFGNSVVVHVVEAIARAMHPYVMQLKQGRPVDVLPIAM